jgi:hypothetical protein
MATVVILFYWRLVNNLAGLIMIAIAFCLAAWGMVSLPPLTIANLTTDPSQYGTRIGMAYTVAAMGALVGNPIAGALRTGSLSRNDSTATVQTGYQGIWLFSAACMLLAAGLMSATRYMFAGFTVRKKI